MLTNQYGPVTTKKKSNQIISLFRHIGPIQKNTHINIGTRKKNQIICSREYVILNRDHAVHINSTIISISFLSKFGIDHCCSLILSSDDNKAAWPLSSSVRSFFSTSNLSAYLRFIDMGELQKWALRANKLIKRFSLDIQVAKNVLNLSTSWYLIWLVCNHCKAIAQEIAQPLTTKIILKTDNLKFHLNLPGPMN